MLFMILCIDKARHEQVRLKHRAAHLEFLARFDANVFAAGPLQSDDGEHMTGSLLLMDFPDRRAAEAFAEDDPYYKAGLFESVAIRRWRKVLPAD